MWKPVVFFYIICVVYFLEHTRLQHAYHDCKKQHASDWELINRDVCTNYEDRILFKESIDCEGAEKRLRMTITVCTLYTWASESNPSIIYRRLTESYFAIIGIVLPIVLMYIYLWSKRKSEMELAEKFSKMIKKSKKKYEPISYK